MCCYCKAMNTKGKQIPGQPRGYQFAGGPRYRDSRRMCVCVAVLTIVCLYLQCFVQFVLCFCTVCTVFLYCFVYVYLLLFVLSVLV